MRKSKKTLLLPLVVVLATMLFALAAPSAMACHHGQPHGAQQPCGPTPPTEDNDTTITEDNDTQTQNNNQSQDNDTTVTSGDTTVTMTDDSDVTVENDNQSNAAATITIDVL